MRTFSSEPFWRSSGFKFAFPWWLRIWSTFLHVFSECLFESFARFKNELSLHTDVYSSFIYNCQDWKQPRCPSVLDKWTMTHPDSGILLSTKKKWAFKLWKDTEEAWMHVPEWEEKPVWKGSLWAFSISMAFWKGTTVETVGRLMAFEASLNT